MKTYFIVKSDSAGQIIERDYLIGSDSIINAIDLSDYTDVGWNKCDPWHRRIFYQEALISTPAQTHVYELETGDNYNLLYDNYSGDAVEMLISPQGRYIIFTYLFKSDSIWSKNLYKTIVLDGNDLSQIGERVSLTISTESPGYMSFVTRNDQYLINPEYLTVSDTLKEDAFVVYSLPNLEPIDTLFYHQMAWRGYKNALDASESGLLFLANRTDSTRVLPPGKYAFIVDATQRRVSSRFIRLSREGNPDVKLAPEGDEIVAVYPAQGKLRRYSLSSGQQISEIDIPAGSSFNFFGEDNNLYLDSPEGVVVVDYRNNRIVRTFRFQGD
jgi:hypothetical protein